MLPVYAFAIGAFAYSTMAQTAAFNTTLMNLNNVATGQILPIFYTSGDGTDISIAFGNTSWTETVASSLSATQGEYDWTVTVPDDFVPGSGYGLVILQSGSYSFSSTFSVSLGSTGVGDVGSGSTPANSSDAGSGVATSGTPSGAGSAASMSGMMSTPTSTGSTAPTTMPNATMSVGPALVTVTYLDPDCTCHKTSTVPATACATNAAGTQYTWYDQACGSTKTAMAPTATSAGTNYTAPLSPNAATTAKNTPYAPTTVASAALAASYTGSAGRLMSSGLAVVGLIVMAIMA
ncbi:hypothetical protein LTR10_023193 [Elasticomyces elasticus]|uniref:Uncharacterized protein n=1 Tax=Exophiala sideris TaxID=1016849 RepID=A0ABR0J2Q8_9EURO|nr:hypothetical protein LTR10_023193 [Elasticomyces elasticus]KAK5024178.1 hypothetical protein LTS07_008913 [Exophiala sideris]KAK5028962.1 hypothetical protein LTR13_008831 [Exophiala sideris]KAK5054890.1 hypothetical protein LTR69_008798 [Exophiala sideris]KAK5178785.1 hypothetical protein LTR44_008612 [Eurotiomycetes sp. CCFEE 6388]